MKDKIKSMLEIFIYTHLIIWGCVFGVFLLYSFIVLDFTIFQSLTGQTWRILEVFIFLLTLLFIGFYKMGEK